jgi:hypothetical protein
MIVRLILAGLAKNKFIQFGHWYICAGAGPDTHSTAIAALFFVDRHYLVVVVIAPFEALYRAATNAGTTNGTKPPFDNTPFQFVKPIHTFSPYRSV